MPINANPWLTPKRFGWIVAITTLVLLLANCIGKPQERREPVQPRGGLSTESKTTLAAMINIQGQLCADVTGVVALGGDRYTVACTRYRDGTGTATYEVDLRTGNVK
jgi:hypothetical protein